MYLTAMNPDVELVPFIRKFSFFLFLFNLQETLKYVA
jgi:hypothetical protein